MRAAGHGSSSTLVRRNDIFVALATWTFAPSRIYVCRASKLPCSALALLQHFSAKLVRLTIALCDLGFEPQPWISYCFPGYPSGGILRQKPVYRHGSFALGHSVRLYNDFCPWFVGRVYLFCFGVVGMFVLLSHRYKAIESEFRSQCRWSITVSHKNSINIAETRRSMKKRDRISRVSFQYRYLILTVNVQQFWILNFVYSKGVNITFIATHMIYCNTCHILIITNSTNCVASLFYSGLYLCGFV